MALAIRLHVDAMLSTARFDVYIRFWKKCITVHSSPSPFLVIAVVAFSSYTANWPM